MIGGIGLLAGPLIGALYIIGLPRFLPGIGSSGLAASSLGWLILILYFPGGLAQLVRPVRDRIVRLAGRATATAPDEAEDIDTAAAPVVSLGSMNRSGLRAAALSAAEPLLTATGLVKRFGGVLAVDGVDLDVVPR